MYVSSSEIMVLLLSDWSWENMADEVFLPFFLYCRGCDWAVREQQHIN